jgi:hypothetical protein
MTEEEDLSIALTRAQAVALTKLIVDDVIESDSGDLLLTPQGSGSIYAAFQRGSFTILADGTTTEEDFG